MEKCSCGGSIAIRYFKTVDGKGVEYKVCLACSKKELTHEERSGSEEGSSGQVTVS